MFGPQPARNWGQVVAMPSAKEFKYWILYVADDGMVRVADPKLVIQPSTRTLTAAEALTALDPAIDETQADIEFLDTLHEFMLGVVDEDAASQTPDSGASH